MVIADFKKMKGITQIISRTLENCNAVYNSWFVCNAPAVINCIFVFHEVKKICAIPFIP